MLGNEIFRKNSIRIFEKSIHGGLGKGNIGVFMARAGVGKTPCLIQIAIDNLLRGLSVLHFAIGQKVDEVRDWYDEILENLLHSDHLIKTDPMREKIESNRRILSYTDNVFNAGRMESALIRLNEHGKFIPDVIIIDGFPSESLCREELQEIKDIAANNNLEIWFAAQTHREDKITNERGIPSPCHGIDDLLSVIVFLEPLEDSVRLILLKDHDNPDLQELSLLLDLNTLLIKDEHSNH